MLLGSKMAFSHKKYIRDGFYENRIYEIDVSKLKNERCVYMNFEKGLPYISKAAFRAQISQNRYIQFLKSVHRIYCYTFNKRKDRKFYIQNAYFQNRI